MAEALHEMSETASELFSELCKAKESRLREVFKRGVRPALESLEGNAYRGFNVTPVAKVLGFQKFIKCFFRLEDGDELEGCNLWVAQSGEQAWVPRDRRPHGFYVVQTEWEPGWGPSQKNSLKINYAASPRNHRLNPERLIADYIVQPDPAEPDCLLGKAFLGFRGAYVFSNYFVLQRHEGSDAIFRERLAGLPVR